MASALLFPRLEGFGITLDPEAEAHASAIGRSADFDYYTFFPSVPPRTLDEEGFARYIAGVRETGAKPYAILAGDEAVGMTTFMDIRRRHRGLEIGGTWIARAHQRTHVNPATKYLMLHHAFETLGWERVQLKCDARNLQSRRAIDKLGATFEGILRKHMILPDGFVRDTVMYSIVRAEWPGVRGRLEARLRGE
jgi:RimJ/RimL family protein N-acetyltransferase